MLDWIAYVRERMPRLPIRAEREHEIVAELAQQFEQTYRDELADGRSEQQALAAVEAQVPDWPSLARELSAGEESARTPDRPAHCWNGLELDLRIALRVISKAPAYALITIGTLALAIGANTAIFSIVNAVLIRPLPFREPGRLVMVYEGMPKFGQVHAPFSTAEFEIFRKAARSYESLAAFETVTAEVSGIDSPERATVAKVSADLFAVMGVAPALGRAFEAGEDVEGNSVAMLSDSYWKRRFGGDPNIVGRIVIVDRKKRTVVGVARADFDFPLRGLAANNETADLFVPMGFTVAELAGRGPSLTKSVIGRLRPGVSVDAARAEARSLVGRVAERFPPEFRSSSRFELTLDVAALHGEVAGNVARILLLLLAAVGLILLIGCANIASLTLTRAAGRRREMAIRTALGASRFQLLRQLMAEALVLASAGGAVGVLAAHWGIHAFTAIAPNLLPVSHALGIDGRVLCFTFGLSILSAVLSGLLPALRASRSDAADAMKDGGRGSSAGRNRQRLLGTLVAVQFTFTFVLLIAGGLLLRSLERLIATDPGFQPAHAVAVSTNLPLSAYPKAAQIRSLYLRVAREAEESPGVKSAGIGTDLPLGQWEQRSMFIEGAGPDGPTPVSSHVWVTGRYLEALGVPLVRGRFFEPAEYAEAKNVVLINETMARQIWPNQDPVGRRLRFGQFEWATIVGVVGDVKVGSLDAKPSAQTYEPHSQLPDRILEMTGTPFLKSLNMVVRTLGDPDAQIQTLSAMLRKTDSQLALAAALPLEQVLVQSSRPQRLNAFLVTGFGMAALSLAVLGIAGVLGYSVAQRRNEIGIRLALGSSPSGVAGLVISQGLRMALTGIATGLVVAIAAARMISSFLYGVNPFDLVTFAAVAVGLTAVALLASWLPARRASNVDPLESLRSE